MYKAMTGVVLPPGEGCGRTSLSSPVTRPRRIGLYIRHKYGIPPSSSFIITLAKYRLPTKVAHQVDREMKQNNITKLITNCHILKHLSLLKA